MPKRDHVNIALIGQAFMGRAHSNAWTQAGHFFKPRLRPVLHTVCARNAESLKGFAATWGWHVIATFNRRALLERLLRQLAEQSVGCQRFEVVVVDDGSAEPVAAHLSALGLPYSLVVETQSNAGAAAARHAGVLRARGEVIVIVDDDMQLDRDFLERHLAVHAQGPVVVLGRIRADPEIRSMPLFERWYARQLERVAAGARAGTWKPGPTSMCTGNVSMRRADYLAVGGFDPAFGRSEDAELGLRLMKAGVPLVFCYEAHTYHGSDHTRLDAWLRGAFRYGVFDTRIAHKHPEVEEASPFRYFFRISHMARPLLGAALALPRITQPITKSLLRSAFAIDRAGSERFALSALAVAYAMEYFRGVRQELGPLGSARELLQHARFRGRRPKATGAATAKRAKP